MVDKARIRQRRAQLLVHSYLYYALNESIVDDAVFDRWSAELVSLQKDLKEPIGFYDEAFADWTGETGMHLPRDGWINYKALQLLRTDRLVVAEMRQSMLNRL